MEARSNSRRCARCFRMSGIIVSVSGHRCPFLQNSLDSSGAKTSNPTIVYINKPKNRKGSPKWDTAWSHSPKKSTHRKENLQSKSMSEIRDLKCEHLKNCSAKTYIHEQQNVLKSAIASQWNKVIFKNPPNITIRKKKGLEGTLKKGLKSTKVVITRSTKKLCPAVLDVTDELCSSFGLETGQDLTLQKQFGVEKKNMKNPWTAEQGTLKSHTEITNTQANIKGDNDQSSNAMEFSSLATLPAVENTNADRATMYCLYPELPECFLDRIFDFFNRQLNAAILGTMHLRKTNHNIQYTAQVVAYHLKHCLSSSSCDCWFHDRNGGSLTFNSKASEHDGKKVHHSALQEKKVVYSPLHQEEEVVYSPLQQEEEVVHSPSMKDDLESNDFYINSECDTDTVSGLLRMALEVSWA